MSVETIIGGPILPYSNLYVNSVNANSIVTGAITSYRDSLLLAIADQTITTGTNVLAITTTPTATNGTYIDNTNGSFTVGTNQVTINTAGKYQIEAQCNYILSGGTAPYTWETRLVVTRGASTINLNADVSFGSTGTVGSAGTAVTAKLLVGDIVQVIGLNKAPGSGPGSTVLGLGPTAANYLPNFLSIAPL